MPDFQYLFTPIRIGTMNVPNRILVSAHGPRLLLHLLGGALTRSEEEAENFIAYYAERAKGGAGWVAGFPEFIQDPWAPGYCEENPMAHLMGNMHAVNYVSRLRKYMDALHRYGAVGTIQLVLQGGTSAPSTVGHVWVDNHVPHALEPEEIKAILDDYRFSAERVREGGADGIEIHANNGDLIQWFLSPATNKRTDEYGGSLENRMQYLREVIDACRAGAGTDFTLGVRLCADEFREDGYGLDDMKEIVKRLTQSRRVDYFHMVVGSNWGVPSYCDSGFYPDAVFAYVGGATREVTDLPVVFTGLVRDPVVAERLLAEGQADVVGMVRAAIADPYFPMKAREGRLDQIRHCIGSLTCITRTGYRGTFGTAGYGKEPHGICTVNPAAGLENKPGWGTLQPATTSKKVVVVGGGPAGLETARVAAERGHQVILLEKADQLGGLVNIAARAPKQVILLDLIRWLQIQLKDLGVDVRLGTEATVDSVLALEPDTVVCATGSLPRRPQIPGIDQPNVVELRDVLLERAPVGDRVVMVVQEDHMQATSCADFLTEQGKQVEFICQTLRPGPDVARHGQGAIFWRLQSKGVKFTIMTRVKAIEGNTVIVQKVFAPDTVERIEGADTIVLACGGEGDTFLYRGLKGRVKELYLTGDAYAPRRIDEAMHQAAAVGRMI